MTTAATKEAAPAVAQALPLQIDPNQLKVQSEGFCWREFLLRLPQGMNADDLKRTDIWRRVQTSRVTLRRHDRLYIVAHDESWVADAIVSAANATDVSLAVGRVVSFPERTRPLFSDDLYRIVWTGAGFVVERKRDGHAMTQPVNSEAVAERELRLLYPRRV